MGKQRKYLDRGRRIALDGRPYRVEWLTLLDLGRQAVKQGRDGSAPTLAAVMWEGITSLSTSPRPALFDHPLLRSALAVREGETMAYLTEQWRNAWVSALPRDADEARELLSLPSCGEGRLAAHLMTAYAARLPEGEVTWYAGFCERCMRAMLLRINDERFSVTWWPFYDQESA